MKMVQGPVPLKTLKLAKYRVRARRVLTAQERLPGLSYLEQNSLQATTLTDYIARLLLFVDWGQKNMVTWTCPETLDRTAVLFLDHVFCLKTTVSDGSKFVAALKFLYPVMARGGSLNLPRCLRSLRAWHRRSPPLQRISLPWLALTAILGRLCHLGHIAVALNLLVQFLTYLRPGVCDRLRVNQVVPPLYIADAHHWGFLLHPAELGVPSKTQGFDEAVFLDQCTWITPFLILFHRRPGPDFLWPTRGTHVVAHLNASILDLSLSHLSPCRYSLRHGGASHDT